LSCEYVDRWWTWVGGCCTRVVDVLAAGVKVLRCLRLLSVVIVVIDVFEVLGRQAEDELTLHMSAQTGLSESEAAHCPRHVRSPWANHLNLKHPSLYSLHSFAYSSSHLIATIIIGIENTFHHQLHHIRLSGCSETNMTTMRLLCMVIPRLRNINSADNSIQLATRSHLPGRIRTRSRQTRFSRRRYCQQDPCRARRNKGTPSLIQHITQPNSLSLDLPKPITGHH